MMFDLQISSTFYISDSKVIQSIKNMLQTLKYNKSITTKLYYVLKNQTKTYLQQKIRSKDSKLTLQAYKNNNQQSAVYWINYQNNIKGRRELSSFFYLQFELLIDKLDLMQNINPFELFKEELDTEDLASRVNTIHKVSIVATLMPVQAIKTTLLPYLDALCKKEDDEVVFAITEQYASLAPMLGNQHTLVLPYLQALCAHDETVVRQRAVNSITKLLDLYSDNDINNYIIPLIIRLASNQANFTCRVSATLLMCNVYPRAGQNKQKIRHKFSDISNEEMLLLQRVTATKISQMCRVYEKEYVLSDLISILKHRSTDEQDQIRVLATQSFKQVSKILTRDQNKTFIMPLIIQAAEDKSWRVRLCLSKNFTEIASNFGKQVTDMSLIQTYSNLLRDSEIDVKIEAVKSLSGFIKTVSPQKIGYLLPQVTALGKDPLAIVRANVGGIIKNMIQSISKDQAYQNVQPLIKELMKDDSQEVRKGGIEAAVKFIEVLGAETVTALYPSLKACSEDTKWRVRLELMRNVCDLATKVQNYDLFSKHLEPLILNFLKDRVSAIREVAIQRIGEYAKIYGVNWISGFMSKLSDVITKDPCFHFKIAAIYSIREICLSVHGEAFLEKALSLIIAASGEPVPNIREVCVKVERDIAHRFQKGSIREAIKKHILSLSQDPDQQVRITVADILNRF